ncbi:MAG: MscL family protein [Candidatus Wallbacteria bacterium]|nr:MscL family protein [Candidatus Wallbacteria bacterium]
MGLIKEFKEFLNEYKVMGMAVAFIMGGAATNLVTALVKEIIMPLITPMMPAGEWQTYKLMLGPVGLGIGPFVAALINFLIMAWVVFMIAKVVLKEEKVAKK